MPQDPKIEALRDVLNVRPRDAMSGGTPLVHMDALNANTNRDLPSVPPAPGFRTDPWIPSPTVRQAYEQLRKIAPEISGRSPRILVGPTGGTAKDLMASGFGPEEYSRTNLMGTYSPSTHEISINPEVASGNADYSLHQTLAHELAHAVGYDEGAGMKKVEAATDAVFPYQKPQDIIEQLTEAFKKIGGTKVEIGR